MAIASTCHISALEKRDVDLLECNSCWLGQGGSARQCGGGAPTPNPSLNDNSMHSYQFQTISWASAIILFAYIPSLLLNDVLVWKEETQSRGRRFSSCAEALPGGNDVDEGHKICTSCAMEWRNYCYMGNRHWSSGYNRVICVP
jgi:hypothetical protein